MSGVRGFAWVLVLGLSASFMTRSLAASRKPVIGRQGMVVSTSALASEIGGQVLREGGNAVDAAVAVGFALAVTWPSAGNLGGGGFALVRTARGDSHFIDYREVAPLAAHEKFYQASDGTIIPEASTTGFRAVGVPGTPAGLELIHKKWGKMSWTRLIEPARKLAAEGYRLELSHVQEIKAHRDLLQKFPETKRIFFPRNRDPEVGDRFVQKDLARSLELLKKEGARTFYQGHLAKTLSDKIQKHGGVITLQDLGGYRVEIRPPLEREWAGYQVLTAPPPSSGGGTLLQMLGTLEADDLKSLGFGSARYLHLLVETMKLAFVDRSKWYGDPGFVMIPIAELLRPSYLRQRRQLILKDEAVASSSIQSALTIPSESSETTHFTIIDKDGMAVSNTYTLNGSFGSGAIAEGTGILLNNEMDDFTSKPGVPNMYGLIQGERNSIAPGKRPLSSMTPTLFVKDDKVVLAVGSPGGPTIINTVLQVSLNKLVHGFNVQEAVDAPRIHHQWLPDQIRWEPNGLNPDTRSIMQTLGHSFAPVPGYLGDAQAIAYDVTTKEWSGGSDSRLAGRAVAP